MAAKPIALVTGSGKQRVGWHVAEALARKNYSVAIHYRTSASQAAETVEHLQQFGVEAVAFQADLANETEVRKMVEGVLRRFGRVDVLVNTAAIWWSKPLEDVTADDVRTFFDTNTLGTFLCCQQVGLAMVRQTEGGSIINIGDWATARPYMDYAAYFVSKGAIPTLTRAMAAELGNRNPRVRVNCILPGPVLLPEGISEAERQQIINLTLVKREGRPQEVAQAVMLFVENSFITGTCLPVDGGRTIYSPGDQKTS